MRVRSAIGTAVLLATVALSARAAMTAWRVAEGDVRVLCPMTIGGSFEARSRGLSGSLTGEPGGGVFAGSLAVDLRTLDTGINLRNDHMRDRYLEVQKGDGYDRAVLSDVRLANPAVETSGGTSPFTASLLLHGVTKPIGGDARLSRRGSHVRVEASFPLDLTAFGIESPRYLGVGVKDQVTVRVAFTAAPAS